MDIQLTDFENTALTIFVGMLANIINYFDVDFVLPISLVDENFRRSHNLDALLKEKFWWKADAVKLDSDGRPLKSDLEANGFLRSQAKPQRTQSEVNDENHKYK